MSVLQDFLHYNAVTLQQPKNYILIHNEVRRRCLVTLIKIQEIMETEYNKATFGSNERKAQS